MMRLIQLACNAVRVYARIMNSDQCYCTAIRTAERRITRVYDDALAPSGITVAQFSLLRKIERNGPVSMTRLSVIMELDRSTVGRNVRVLKKLGLAEIEPGEDQREASAVLTDTGRETIALALPLWRAAQDHLEQVLGDKITQAIDAFSAPV